MFREMRRKRQELSAGHIRGKEAAGLVKQKAEGGQDDGK